jgi:hypothetical protein
MVVQDVERRRQRRRRGETAVHDRVEVLRPDRRQPAKAHAAVLGEAALHVVVAAEHGDVVAPFGEERGDLLHVALDPAPSGRHPATPDHGDAQRPLRGTVSPPPHQATLW